MPGGRRIPVTVDADTKGDFDKAADGLDHVAKSGDDAEKSLGKLTKGEQALDAEINKTANSIKSLRAEFEKTGDVGLLKDASKLDRTRQGLERLRTQFSEVGRSEVDVAKVDQSIVHLSADIDKTKAALKSMGDEFQRSGKVNVDELKKLSGALRELERAKAAVEKLVPGDSGKQGKRGGGLLDFALDEFAAKAAKGVGGAVVNGLESGIQSAGKAAASNPWIAGGIAAGILLGTPVIGAALTAAVGGGVIAGGILLASKDPRVGSAWSALGESAKTSLTGAADVFVGPLVHGAQTFGATLDRIMPSLTADFARLSPVADKLFTGAAGFVEALMPGIDALSTAAGPILTDLAVELPKLGAAVSSAFRDISAGGAGGAQAMRDMLTSIEITIAATGKFVRVLEDWWLLERSISSMLTGDLDGSVKRMGQLMYGTEATTPVADRATAAYRAFASSIGAAGSAAPLTAAQLATLSGQINATALTTDVLAGQMAGKVLNSMMSLDQAALGFARSQTSLGDTLRQNGLELDIHTAKGEANRGAILAGVQANMAQYQANISVGMAAGDAAKAYDDNTQALERQLQQAGFTQGAIDGLIGKYKGVPATVDTEIATKGLTAAIGGLEDAIRLANHLNGRVSVLTIEERHRTTYTNDIAPSQYFGGLATGGMRTATGIRHAAVGTFIPPSDPGTVLTGEPQTGGEWLIPAQGISPARAQMLGNAALGNYGLDVVPRSSGYASPVTPRGGSAGAGGGAGQSMQLDITVKDDMGRLFTVIGAEVRGRYGGDVLLALGGAS